MSLFWRLYVPPALTCLSSGTVVAVILVGRPESSAELELSLLTLAVVFVLVFTALLVRNGIAPLEHLHHAVQEVNERGGGLVRLYRDDEIGRLAGGYNTLVTRLEQQRNESLRMALLAQEAERLRISRELHDEVGQTLTLVQRKIQQMQDPTSSRSHPEELRVLSETIGDLIDSVRSISDELRPDILDDLGLVPAIRELLRRVDESGDLTVLSSCKRPSCILSDELQIAVYRIAQESLTNVVRHAEASHVTCVLRPDDEYLYLSVQDDGSGNMETAGNGLRGMRERAAIIGGDLSIVSVPGHGTSVNLRVPLAAGGEHQ